jgi:putative iron-regulated protein
MRQHLLALSVGTVLTLASVISIARGEEVTAGAVLKHYGDVAEAMYGDAAAAAADLAKAIEALIAEPNDKTLAAARAAWKEARDPGISRARAIASAMPSSMTGRAA